METRNFYILVASIVIGLFVVFMTIYALLILDVNPLEDQEVVVIKGSGMKAEMKFTLDQLKSNKYHQIKDKQYYFINSWGTEYQETYSGVSLWSILDVEDALKDSPEKLTFQFKARDGYISPEPLNLSVAKDNIDLVILAYIKDGIPLTDEGPIRSIVDRSVNPTSEPNSHYAVQKLYYILIERV